VRIAYDNEIDNASTITAGTELSGFEIDNVQDQRLGTIWASSTATTQTVTITYASTTATSIQTLAILGHNITTACTVTVSGNSEASWGSPAFTTTLTVLSDYKPIVKYLDDALQYKYWQFAFSGQASLEVGRLWQSGYIQITPSSTLDFSVVKKRSDIVIYGKHRQKFSDEGVGWRQVNLSFPPTATTTLELVQTCIDTVGNHSSFIFCNFDDIRDYEIVEPLYGSFVGDVSFSHTIGVKFSYSLTIEEDK